MAWVKLGEGTLNKSKDPSKGAPYYGKCKLTIDGEEMEFNIGAWVKETEKYGKFFSLAFSVQEEAAPKTSKKKNVEEEEDPIPF